MLDVQLEFRKGILFVRLKGSLVRSNLYVLKNEVRNLILNTGIYNVVFNIKYVDRIDTSGIDALYDLYHILAMHGGRGILCTDSREVQSQIRHSYLNAYMHMIGSEIDAFPVVTL